MANVDVISGEQILVLVDDGTGAFSHRCMINTERGMQSAAEVTSTPVPDCDDPSAPAWVYTDKSTLSRTISGSGLVDVVDVEFWDDFWSGSATKAIKYKLNKVGGSTWTGNFHCTQFDTSGARKEKGVAAITLVSDGPVLRADNA